MTDETMTMSYGKHMTLAARAEETGTSEKFSNRHMYM